MDYSFKCHDCDIQVEHNCLMSEIGDVEMFCPECGDRINQVYSVPFVTGELPNVYMYDDPTLGQVIGKKDRETKMNKMGLTDYRPDPMIKEFKHIRGNVEPKKRGLAINGHARKAMNVKRGEMIDRKLDKALRTLHVEQPRG